MAPNPHAPHTLFYVPGLSADGYPVRVAEMSRAGIYGGVSGKGLSLVPN